MDKLINYIKGTKQELRHVSWPSGKQTALYTALVIVVSVAVAAYLGAFDYLFTHLLEILVF